MTDEQIIQKLELIISEMSMLREKRSSFARSLQDAKRIAAVAVAARDFKMLKNPSVVDALNSIPKPTVAEKEYLVELEIGEFAFQEAVIDSSMKMLERELEAVKTLAIHVASIRKAERV